MKAFQINYVMVFSCIFAMLLPCGLANVVNTKRSFHRRLKSTARDSLTCYRKAHYLSSTHRGGPLWNEIKKLLITPRSTPASLRDKDCLAGLSSITAPLRQIVKTDKTVGVCADGKTVKNHLKRLNNILKDTISYYKRLNVVTSPVSVHLNMTALTNLAANDAKKIVLNNGKQGVPADVLRNLQILDLVSMMSINLKRECI